MARKKGAVPVPDQAKVEMKTLEAVKALPLGQTTNIGGPALGAPNQVYEEWYTPPEVIEAARRALGGIDLDPASSPPAKANETVRATAFLTVHSMPGSCDVERRWPGRVWLNPPYSTGVIERFVGKLVSEYEHPDGGTTAAILLTQNATETQWLQLAMSRASAICFPRARLNFIRDGEVQGDGPRRGHALFYFGPDPLRFERTFREIGRCVYPSRVRGAPSGSYPRAIPPTQRAG